MTGDLSKSSTLWQEANRYLVGGVNSPVRAFKAVGGEPIFIQGASGSRIVDADGNEYVDHVMSWGPMILGHAHPKVIGAIKDTAANGTSYGIPTALETDLARKIVESVPSIEKVRMVNSGTEATMSAIRLARGYTERDLAIKFEGCYHGHVDGLLVKAGSGVATLGISSSPGIPKGYAENTAVLPYNDIDAVKQFCSKRGKEVACIIIEPVAGNMGVIPPEPGFLEGLREISTEHGIVLIFDEVITGFRVALGGAQSLYGVSPDLTTLGKIIGGGLPVGAYGGKAEIMDCLAPVGPVYQAGTLSGNPLAMAAGLATLEKLSEKGTYEQLEKTAQRLATGLQGAASKTGVKVAQTRVGSMLTLFFTEDRVKDYQSVMKCDTEKYAAYFHEMFRRGVYLAPSQFEACFVSTAHTDEDIDKTVTAASEALELLR